MEKFLLLACKKTATEMLNNEKRTYTYTHEDNVGCVFYFCFFLIIKTAISVYHYKLRVFFYLLLRVTSKYVSIWIGSGRSAGVFQMGCL